MAVPSPPIRVLIAADLPVFREGLCALLAAEPGFLVVGEATDVDEVLPLAGRVQPDILILDLAMPRSSGFGVLARLQELSSPVRTVVLTARIDLADVTRALESGARGVVLTGSSSQPLLACLAAVASGQYWLSREIREEAGLSVATLVYPPSGQNAAFPQKA